MNFAEILDEIPNLSFAERQELVRRVMEIDVPGLSDEENRLLDARLEDFQRDPTSGIPLEDLRRRMDA